MKWQFWKNGSNVGKLPARLSRQLAWRLGLSNEAMESLQYASKPGGPMNTLFVRVYDPKSIASGPKSIRGYADLDAQKSAIQFECRWHPSASKLEDLVDLRASAST